MEITNKCRALNLLRFMSGLQASADMNQDFASMIAVGRTVEEWSGDTPDLFDPSTNYTMYNATEAGLSITSAKVYVTNYGTTSGTDKVELSYNGEKFYGRRLTEVGTSLISTININDLARNKEFGLYVEFGLKAKDTPVIFRQLGFFSDKSNKILVMGQNMAKQTVLKSGQDYTIKMILNF